MISQLERKNREKAYEVMYQQERKDDQIANDI